MPLYEYKCNTCRQTVEYIQKVSEAPKTDCSNCGAKGSLVRLISPPAIQFKGSGWYLTDYSDKGKKSRAAAESESASEPSSSSKDAKKTKSANSSTDSTA